MLVGVMAPMLALAGQRTTLEAVAAASKGAGSDPAVSPSPVPAAPEAAPAASPEPAATTATTSAVAISPDEKKAETLGLSVEVDLDHWLGTGTFINPNYYAYL